VRILRDREQPEQVLGGPAEPLSLLAPSSEEAPSVVNRLPPSVMLDMLRAAPVENI
jgi:hypothetical protein